MRSLLLASSLPLGNRLPLAPKLHPMRSLLRVRQLQLVRSLPRILRKKRPKPKSALINSEFTATGLRPCIARNRLTLMSPRAPISWARAICFVAARSDRSDVPERRCDPPAVSPASFRETGDCP